MTKEEVIKEYRVREILEAARRVLARYGMQGTTVDRVAEEAKVAKGTIYLYFDTKDELVHASVLEGLREMVAETIASDDASIPPLERIRKLILAQLRIQASNQDFLKT
ncbi:MAG TPA: helix-turn-helix domain-containing protein, partial [Candidatus Acidoferrum sp.]|nr:helix-turn-helix domain-containing protein [Candidatus Acidoferrum sp.]